MSRSNQSFPQIQDIAKLSLNEFLLELDKIKNQKGLMRDMCQFLKISERPQRTKADLQKSMLICTGINWIIKKCFPQGNQQKKIQLWSQFRDIILLGKIEWKQLSILEKSCHILFENFEQHFSQTINQLFNDLPILQKIMVFQAVFDQSCQLSTKSRVIFIRENIEKYLEDLLNLLTAIHQNQIDILRNFQVQKAGLNNILITIQYLYNAGDQSNNIASALTKNSSLLKLIDEILSLSLKKQGVKSSPFVNTYIHYSRNQIQDQKINEYKTIVLKVINNLFDKSFKYHCPKEMFDSSNYPILMIVNNIVGEILLLLVHSNRGSNSVISYKEVGFSLKLIKNKASYKQIIIELILLLKNAVKFNHFSDFFIMNSKEVYFQLIYPLLLADEDQVLSVFQDPQDFIQRSDDLIQSLDECETVKRAAGQFLEEVINKLHQTLLYLLTICCDGIEFQLSRNAFLTDQLKQLIQEYGVKPSLQCFLLILSIIHPKIKDRDDISLRLAQICSKSELMDIKPIEKARLYIFLSYNFYHLHPKIQNQKNFIDYLISKEEILTNIFCKIQLFYNILTVEHQINFKSLIWEQLMRIFQQTENYQIIERLNSIIRGVGCQKINQVWIYDIIDESLHKFSYEIQKHRGYSSGKNIKGTPLLYQILKTIKIIIRSKNSDKTYYLTDKHSMIDPLWVLFQNLRNPGTVQFDDEILQIYTDFLKIFPQLDEIHFQYLNYYNEIIKQREGMNKYLFDNYILLLSKGRVWLMSNTDQSKKTFDLIIEHLQILFSFKSQSCIQSTCNLLYYILFYYNQKISPIIKDQFINFLQQVYENRKQDLSQSTIAAILNIIIIQKKNKPQQFMVGMNMIKNHSFKIFNNYQSNLFILGLVQTVKQRLEQMNVNQITQYLLYGLRVLKQIKLRKINKSYLRTQSSCQVSVFMEIDPFRLIKETFDLVKGSNYFQKIISEIHNQFPSNDLFELLTLKIVDNKARKILKVK